MLLEFGVPAFLLLDCCLFLCDVAAMLPGGSDGQGGGQGGGRIAANLHKLPAWSLDMERSYPFSQYAQDLLL